MLPQAPQRKPIGFLTFQDGLNDVRRERRQANGAGDE